MGMGLTTYVRLLYCANVTIATFFLQDGKSALTIAAEDGMTEIVSSLIAHPRININILDMVRLYHIE